MSHNGIILLNYLNVFHMYTKSSFFQMTAYYNNQAPTRAQFESDQRSNRHYFYDCRIKYDAIDIYVLHIYKKKTTPRSKKKVVLSLSGFKF